MNELGNTPADKNYKPSGIINDLMEGQLKAVQLSNGTLVTEELAKSMTRAQEAALKAFPGQQFIHDRCVFRFGYEQAEKDIIDIVKQYIEKGERCMKQSIDDGEGDLYTFWDGFHNCAENILRELEDEK